MKPKESVRCHQTLSSQVGSGHETMVCEGESLLQQPLFVEQYTKPNKKSQSIKSLSIDFNFQFCSCTKLIFRQQWTQPRGVMNNEGCWRYVGGEKSHCSGLAYNWNQGRPENKALLLFLIQTLPHCSLALYPGQYEANCSQTSHLVPHYLPTLISVLPLNLFAHIDDVKQMSNKHYERSNEHKCVQCQCPCTKRDQTDKQ